MPRHVNPWTQTADDILRQAVLEGRSLPAICQQLGRTQAAVRARVHVLGLSLRVIGGTRRGLSKRNLRPSRLRKS